MAREIEAHALDLLQVSASATATVAIIHFLLSACCGSTMTWPTPTESWLPRYLVSHGRVIFDMIARVYPPEILHSHSLGSFLPAPLTWR
jgi:hypothetical protein